MEFFDVLFPQVKVEDTKTKFRTLSDRWQLIHFPDEIPDMILVYLYFLVFWVSSTMINPEKSLKLCLDHNSKTRSDCLLLIFQIAKVLLYQTRIFNATLGRNQMFWLPERGITSFQLKLKEKVKQVGWIERLRRLQSSHLISLWPWTSQQEDPHLASPDADKVCNQNLEATKYISVFLLFQFCHLLEGYLRPNGRKRPK